MSKTDEYLDFNPSSVGVRNGKLFGLPFEYEDSHVVILPVPWEVTVSYRAGTAQGPQAILEASTQVDLFDPVWPDGWRAGYYMLPISREWQAKNEAMRAVAAECIRKMEQGVAQDDPDLLVPQGEVNAASSELNDWVERQAQSHLSLGKAVGVLGGDHSVPLGLIRALATRYDSFGVLHIDAHADLRRGYEGFQYSHASIMENVLHLPHVSKITQVGIRDYCEEERTCAREAADRVATHFDHDWRVSLANGARLRDLCAAAVERLPRHVYVSFDIDGLDPSLCPHTGTPVPGGLAFHEAAALLEMLAESGRRIVGFDLCEVCPGGAGDEWDANVGARTLYKLCGAALRSGEQSSGRRG